MRAYTVAEIDQMRAALRERFPYADTGGGIFGTHQARHEYELGVVKFNEGRDRQIEDQIRTYMLAGVDPADLVAIFAKRTTEIVE